MNKKIKKKKRKLKKSFKLGVLIFLIIVLLSIFIYLFTPVSNSTKEQVITIESGASTKEIATILKDNKLIKSKILFEILSKIKNANFYAAIYKLSPNMTINEIIEELQSSGININDTTITIKEGQNIRQIAKLIEENTNINYDDIIAKTKDKEYLNELIDKYWFIEKDIKNTDLYYNLEGYLFPDTYSINKEETNVENIFALFLNQMDQVLSEYKKDIEKSEYSIHKLLTLASITQSEGYDDDDFKNIASVFYNRMNDQMALGSCVTSYYGVKKDMDEALTNSDINDQNKYNTRGDSPVLFPVGPISSPGKKAIEAVVNPIKTNYYYFVSDKNHKLYFTKTLKEHEQTITKLEQEGLWLEW